jgi:ATP:ADP antiporter, AAA family
MRDKFRILSGIEPAETSNVSMLLTQSVFLGIFLGAYDISAYSLLLSTFDEKLMARGYVLSGLAGIILTSVHLRLRKTVKISKLAFINLIIVSVATLILWSLLEYYPAKWIVVVVFIMAGPLNILIFFGFWAMTEKFLGTNKRLSGLADSGLLAGIALISFTIPLLMSLKFKTQNILLPGALSVLIAAFIQKTLGAHIRLDDSEIDGNSEKTIKTSFLSAIRNNKFYKVMGMYATISVLVAFVIQYSFMAIARRQYPGAEDMARFLGLFTGSMMLITEFVKRIIFPPLIRLVGIRGCLIISPVLIFPITIMAIVIGLSIGFTMSSAGFIIFFSLLALNRIISKSMKDSIEVPSFKIIYQSLQNNIRKVIQNGISYSVNEVGVLLSGIILSIFGFLSFIRVLHFSFLLLFLVLVWMYLAIRLYKEFRKSVIKTIGNEDESFIKAKCLVIISTYKNRFAGQLFFKTNYFNLLIGDYEVLNSIRNEWYFKELIDYALSKNDLNLVRVLKTISMNADLDDRIRQQSTEAIEILQNISTSFSHSRSQDLKPGSGTKIFSDSRMPQTSEILSLLRSNSVESKRQAIFLIGKFRLSDLLYVVCECLSIRGLASDAFKVLQSFGPYAEDDLVRFYLIMSGNIRLSKTILQLLGKICSKGKSGFLYSRLWSNSRQLKEVVVKGLINCKFDPNTVEKQRLDQLISEITGIIAWNLSVKIILIKNNDDFLLNIINIETERWMTFLFNILSLTYGSASVELINKNLNIKTINNSSYVREIANLVFSNSVKSHLLPLLEDVPDKVKVKKLSRFFPVEIGGHDKLIEDILNRDYNLIGLWTKACALRAIGKIDGPEISESVVALLFSPEPILQEESVNLIKRSGKELYYSACNRLSDATKTRLDKILTGGLDRRDLVFEKVQFLVKCFNQIIEEDLISLASELYYSEEFTDSEMNSSDGCIVWTLDKDKPVQIQILYNGILGSVGSLLYKKNQPHYSLTFAAVEEYYFQYPTESLMILKYIDENDSNQ